jgi:hypothetical protein
MEYRNSKRCKSEEASLHHAFAPLVRRLSDGRLWLGFFHYRGADLFTEFN